MIAKEVPRVTNNPKNEQRERWCFDWWKIEQKANCNRGREGTVVGQMGASEKQKKEDLDTKKGK